MNSKFFSILLTVAISAVSTVAFAQFGGMVNPMGGGASSSGGASADQIVQKYVGGTQSVLKADANMLGALGLKELAAKAELHASNLTKGATEDSLKESNAFQTESSKAMDDKFTGEKVVMDAKSKKQFGEGMLDLANGIKQYVGMTSDVKGFKPSATSLGGSASSAMFVAKSLPDSITNLGSTLKKAIDFAKTNKITIPKEANEATSLL